MILFPHGMQIDEYQLKKDIYFERHIFIRKFLL